MDKYFLMRDGEYAVGIISTKDELASPLSEKEKDNILSLLCNKPNASPGFTYKLRADTLEWELVELPPEPDPGEEDAEIEDYEQALADLGVRV